MSDAREIENEKWQREMSLSMGKVLTLTEAQSDDLRDIKEQTLKTNGRVSKLERWRSYLAGGMAVIALILGLYFHTHI